MVFPPRLAPLLLPYTRRELFEWQRLLQHLGIGWQAGHLEAWNTPALAVVRGKEHGFLMELDRRDWAQRLTYFIGRYYEFGVLRTLDVLLRPGDHFVDVGANIGMTSLHARARVGATGRIDCFEPNPSTADLLDRHVALNNLKNVHVHRAALSDKREELQLRISDQHSGTATLAETEASDRSVTVPVLRGDDVIDGAPDVVKIDVEGFELRALRGMEGLLLRHRPALITEMIDQHLGRAGSSVLEVARWLSDRGYRASCITSYRPRRYLSERLKLVEVESPSDIGSHTDVLWTHSSKPMSRAGLIG